MTASKNKVVLLPSCLRGLKGDYFRWNEWKLSIQLKVGEQLWEQLREAPLEFWQRVKGVRASHDLSWKVDHSWGERSVAVEFIFPDTVAVGFMVFQKSDSEIFRKAPEITLEW